MKKKILICVAIIAMIIISFLTLTFDKNSPQVNAKYYLDILFQSDQTNLKKLGLSNKDYQQIKEEEEEIIMNKILENPSLACAMFDSQTYQHQFISQISDGLKKLDYSVSQISVNDNQAKVKVTIRYFTLETIIKNGQKRLMEQFEKHPFTSAQENIDETYRAIEEAFNEGPVEKTTDIVVTLEKKKNIWVMDNHFIKNVCEGIIK